MDSRRFDHLAKQIAAPLSRRAALRRLAGSAVAVGLVGQTSVLAAQSTPVVEEITEDVCVFNFEADVRSGPSAGLALVGVLRVPAQTTGTFDDGVLIVADPANPDVITSITVVGQANGRAINLLLDVGDGDAVYGVGTLETDLATCTGRVGGPLVGPAPGDQGDWAASVRPGAGGYGPERGCSVNVACLSCQVAASEAYQTPAGPQTYAACRATGACC